MWNLIPPHVNVLSEIEGIRSGKEAFRGSLVLKMIYKGGIGWKSSESSEGGFAGFLRRDNA